MVEAYFEKIDRNMGEGQYPFECFISDNHGKDMHINPHWHYYIELLYSISGQAKVFLGGECYLFHQGDVLLINAREVHSIALEGGRDTKYICIKFNPEVLYTTTRTTFESKYVLPFTMAKFAHQKMFLKEEIKDTPIPALIDAIYKEFIGKNYGFELAVRADICRVFLWFLCHWQEKGLSFDIGSTVRELNIEKLQEVFAYLDQHYQEHISTQMVARMCNMSYGYFCRQFKEIMGKTFIAYLNYIRIMEAEKLLLTTDLNITQISLNTGFSSTSYFIEQFKHFRNVSPKQFRKKMLQGNY